jgi:uncharacterized protein (DUF58 family)
MIPVELIRKIKKIEIHTKNIVNTVFSGEYQSVFKGQGMEFSEVREYQDGDDIRLIDWNVSARMGDTFVKKYVEERELTIIFAVDASSSGEFGTFEKMKGDIAVELCAVLAFSAIKNNDRVGLIIFTDKVEKFIPPKKGKTHVLRLIRELLYFKPEGKKTNLENLLEHITKAVKRKSVVFVISDFLDSGYETSLRVANKKHDIIAITITDPRELEIPDIGFIELEDSETGEIILLDTSSERVRRTFASNSDALISERDKIFKSMNVDSINIFSNKSYIEPLIKFFRMRAQKFR